MVRERGSKLIGLLSELSVVFLGVFIALGAESWWEQREESARVRTYLGAVTTDLSLAREELDSSVQSNLERLYGVGANLDQVVTGRVIADTVVFRCCPGPTRANLPLGNLSALLETGDINLLTPESLRATLIANHALLEYAETARTYYHQQTFEAYAEVVAELDHERARIAQPEGRIPLRVAAGNRDLLAAERRYWAALRELIGREINIGVAVAEMHEAIASQSGIENVSHPRPAGTSTGQPIDLSDTALARHVGRYRMFGTNGPTVLTVVLSDGELSAGFGDGVEYRLIPESESLFFIDGQGIQIEFIDADGTGTISGLLHQFGLSFPITPID